MKNLIKNLSIAQRLWLNLSLGVLITLVIVYSGLSGLFKAQSASQSLIEMQAADVVPINQLTQSYRQMIDQMMNALLNRSEEAQLAFNTRSESFRSELVSLFESKGVELALDGNGYYRPVETSEADQSQSEPNPNSETPQIELQADVEKEAQKEILVEGQEALQAQSNLPAPLLNEVLQVDRILLDLQKVVASYLFLRKDIENTYEFGIETSLRNIEQQLQTLSLSENVQDSTELVEMSETLLSKLEASKRLAPLYLVSNNPEVLQNFHQQGLGDSADKIIEVFSEELSSAFLLQESLEGFVNSRDSLVESMHDIRDAMHTAQENNQTIYTLINQGQSIFDKVSGDYQQKSVQALDEVEVLSSERIEWMLWIAVIGVVLMLMINFVFLKSITQPLSKMKAKMRHMQQTMVFDSWSPAQGRNELTEMENVIGELLHTFASSMQEVIATSEAMAQGDLSSTLSSDYRGDLKKMADHFNQSLFRIHQTLNEIEEVSHALAQGNLNYQISVDEYPGQYRVVLRSLQRALKQQRQAIEEVQVISQAMEQGNFSRRIENEMPGDLANLKLHFNDALDNLEAAILQKVGALQAYSSGDFSYEMEGEFQGRLYELKDHMSNMASKVSHMLEEVKESTLKAETGVAEISQGNEELNQRVQKQAGFIQKTSARMGTMMTFLEGSYQQSNEMAKASYSVKESSSSGLATIDEMVNAMQQIETASQQIASMTDVIDSIAFQTNLLALNASVEAARAGEMGRGFAVVAQEVRNLANRSGEASKQIRQVTEDTLEKVSIGMELTSRTQKIFSKNAQSIEQIASQALKMQNSIEHQNESICEVNQSLLEIEQSTQANAELVEQVTATSAEIIDQMGGLQAKVTQFRLKAKPVIELQNIQMH